MGKPIIIVSSITYALKGQKVLSSQGIVSYIERSTPSMSKRGCGYGLRVNGDVNRARGILEQAGVHVRNVIEEGGQG